MWPSSSNRPGGHGDVWVEYADTAVPDRFASYPSRLPEETAHGICNDHRLHSPEAIIEWEKKPDG